MKITSICGIFAIKNGHSRFHINVQFVSSLRTFYSIFAGVWLKWVQSLGAQNNGDMSKASKRLWKRLVFKRKQAFLVEISGIEPLTSWLPVMRSPSWAIPPSGITIAMKFWKVPIALRIGKHLWGHKISGLCSQLSYTPKWNYYRYEVLKSADCTKNRETFVGA